MNTKHREARVHDDAEATEPRYLVKNHFFGRVGLRIEDHGGPSKTCYRFSFGWRENIFGNEEAFHQDVRIPASQLDCLQAAIRGAMLTMEHQEGRQPSGLLRLRKRPRCWIHAQAALLFRRLRGTVYLNSFRSRLRRFGDYP